MDDTFITGADGPCGVAVGPAAAPPPSNAFTLGKLKRNKKKGTAKLTVEVPGAGTLDLSGSGVKPQRPVVPGPVSNPKPVAGPGAVKLSIKATGKKKKSLKKKGKVKLKVKVTFTPTGGSAASQAKSVKLKRKK